MSLLLCKRTHSRTPQGKECVQGKPLPGFPCAFNQRPPQAALIFAPQKSAVPSLAPNNKTTPKGVVLVVRQFRCRYSRIPQGRGSVRGKPLRVSPLAFHHPPAGDRFCIAKPHQKEETHESVSPLFGAGDRTRTGTLSPAVDFESTTSTNSITPAGATRSL